MADQKISPNDKKVMHEIDSDQHGPEFYDQSSKGLGEPPKGTHQGGDDTLPKTEERNTKADQGRKNS